MRPSHGRVRRRAKGVLSTLWTMLYRPPLRPRGEIRRIRVIAYPPGLGDYVVAILGTVLFLGGATLFTG